MSAVLISVLVTSCSGSGGSSGTATGGSCQVNTLLVANMTGAQSDNGKAAVIAASAAVKSVNDGGGVNGCQLVLTTKDDGSDYTKTLPLVQSAMGSQTYSMVSVNDYGTASVVPYLTRQKVLSISSNGTAALADSTVNPYYFDTVPPSSTVSKYVTQYAISQGAKKLAVVTDNSTLGTDAIAADKATAEAGGASLVASVQVDATTINMTPAVQSLSNSGADAVIIDLYGQPAGYFVRDLKASGWNVTRYGTSSLFATNLDSLLPVSDYEGIVAVGPTPGTAPALYGVSAMQTQIKADGGDATTSVTGLAQNYADIILFAWAANGAHSTDSAAVAKYLEEHGTDKVPNDTIAETTGYTASNHQMTAPGTLSTATEGAMDSEGLLPRITVVN
ncbi:MAG: branched-chain amino acid transporter substrate-binding protein [Subtercola sp.]|nr:branched-chain amino acid transporter substrate-binding protein [Subtercola sp.]